MNDKISIIIPAFNIQDYLGNTLDSVLAQSYDNLEIIVVNDGSKDNTGSILDDYAQKDSRIKAIYQENSGVTSARLCGIQAASGAYIGFVDGDDFIEPQMYMRLMENAKRFDADISHCGYQMVFPAGRIDYYYNTGRIVKQEGKQGCTDLLNGYFVEPGLVNKLYRRGLFFGLDNWMDKSIKINEDLLMNFYLFRKAEKCVFEDVCPYHYVLRQGSAATAHLNKHKLKDPLSVLHILQKETTDIPEWNQIVERRVIYQLVNSATIQPGEQRELIVPFRREARRELRQRLWGALTGSSCEKKLKVMTFWAAVWPASYGWVHSVYAKATGLDKKYSVE